jgi:RimJ/RimL family protein N-acetyltransferase
MTVCTTPRLSLRHFTPDDAGFVLRLLNDPAFLRYIGDKGVRDRESALRYLHEGPLASYARHGFGLFLVASRDDDVAIGMCGLLKRDYLADVDLGYAFLPEHVGHGYALEAASAAVDLARTQFGLPRLLAITDRDNAASIRLLRKLGFAYSGDIGLNADGPELNLFALDLASGS